MTPDVAARAERFSAESAGLARAERAAHGSARLPHAHGHHVQFYEDDSYLGTVVSEFLARGLAAGQPVVVIASQAHRAAFLEGLRHFGADVREARRSGQLVMLDAGRLLARFMDGNVPNAARFRRLIGRVLDKATALRPGTTVCAYGEMVDLLQVAGNSEGAVRLEHLWNDLAREYDFALLCAYRMGGFARASDAPHFARICDAHDHVVPTEQYVARDGAERLREITALQQRARALEAEIAERERLEQELRATLTTLQRREEDLRDVVENAAEGIHLVGPDGTILWANDAELELLGYRPEEYVGRNIMEFHADACVVDDMLARLARGESLREYRARLRHKDGSVRHVLVNSNVRWRDGEFMHTRCFTRDITAIECAMTEAFEARALAEQANRAKSDFLAMMSHELRTPLNAIGGHAELMELGLYGPMTIQQQDAIERIQKSQRLLLGLVNQVLNYARIERGNVRYAIAEVPLDQCLRGAESVIASQLRAKGLEYGYAGCATDLRVHADGERLQQIVLNLLTNAMKFTEAGGRVELVVRPEEHAVHIDVTDSGVGIHQDKLELIFDPFVQVDATYTRTHEGVGLGLAISRDLARGMGGELSVRSEVGVGSTFTCSLRRAGHRHAAVEPPAGD